MSQNKKKKNCFLSKSTIILNGIGALIGFFIGIFLAKNGFDKISLPIWLLLVYSVVVFCMIIVIHEAGHLVMGLATGYKFVSFRIGSLIFIKEDGKIRLRRFSIVGMAGQCLMMPPETDAPEQLPYFLYHFGGGLFNLITAAVCGLIALFIGNNNAGQLLGIAAVFSVLVALMNLIPMVNNVSNDGTNILLLKRSRSIRIALYRQLYINGLLHQGVLPRDISAKYFSDVENDGKMGLHSCIMPMLQGSLAIDNKDFKSAQTKFEEIFRDDKLILIYKNEITCELIFCKIMNGASKEEIDELYDKSIKNYVKQTASMLISKRRLLYAYNLILLGDQKAADKEYEAAQKMKKTYPNKGELYSELELIEYVKEIAVSKITANN